jgi:hypothetical protein
MTTLMTTASGARRTLAHEIDRLDEVLNGLSDNLGEAVGDAVRVAASQDLRQAAREAIRDALSERDLLMAQGPKFQEKQPPQGPSPLRVTQGGWLVKQALVVEGWIAQAGSGLRCCQSWLQDRWADLGHACLALWNRMRPSLGIVVVLGTLLWLLRWHVLIGIGGALLLGVTALLSAPAVATVAATVGGFVLTFLVPVRVLPLPGALTRTPPEQEP